MYDVRCPTCKMSCVKGVVDIGFGCNCYKLKMIRGFVGFDDYSTTLCLIYVFTYNVKLFTSRVFKMVHSIYQVLL